MNDTHFDNDIRTDDLFIESDLWDDLRLSDASPDDVPVWIENEDGSGQWSDGWTGNDDDAFFCYEDGDEWLGPPLDTE
jgi:hypothetical protein